MCFMIYVFHQVDYCSGLCLCGWVSGIGGWVGKWHGLVSVCVLTLTLTSNFLIKKESAEYFALKSIIRKHISWFG